jgi:hypothetical protein
VHLVGVEALVLARRAGEVPRVDHEVGAEELIHALGERRRAHEALVRQVGDRRVVEGALHRVAHLPERLHGVVVDRGSPGRPGLVHEPEERGRRVHDVLDHIACRPSLA